MSLLLESESSLGTPAPLAGNEVLLGPDPSVCKIKGVMFGGRKQFLLDQFGEEGYYAVLARLSPETLKITRTPLASAWYDFAALVELDKTIYEFGKEKHPHILELVGAASAELGIGRVYRMLDNTELLKFLENIASFHQQYQKYGRVEFHKTPHGARMDYLEYPCYSPYYCASALGFYKEAILRHGGTDPRVVEVKCHCRGDAVCSFEMEWK
ncbi:MAG: hypothetical protein WBX15_10995 [Thermoanaerobaculia bacterium]